MRNFLTIALLVVLAVVGFMVLQVKPRDTSSFNPDGIGIAQHLVNKNGNVLWINLSGIRSDHIGSYGYDNTTTPSIDSFSGQSILFERCYAQSTESYRSMTTMLTSEYPVCYPASNRTNTSAGFRDLICTPEPTLVAAIRDSGHTTCAVVSNSVLKGAYGFAEGFDYFDDHMINLEDSSFRVRDSGETFDAAESWLSRNFRRPFFMLVQFPDPKGPYNAEPRFENQLHQLKEYGNPKVIPVSDSDDYPLNQIPAYHGISGETPTVGEMIRRYDAEIVETDYYIGKLLDTLYRLDINDDTMVVISGLHGQSLGEHGYYFNYGQHVHHNLSSIPLIVHIPNGGAARIKDVVEGIDIMPTILGYMGVKPNRRISGMNLMGFSSRPNLKDEYPAFCYWDEPNKYSVIKGNYELIRIHNQDYRLYHVINDPEEIYDLYSADDPVGVELKKLLDAWLRDNHKRALENEIERNYGPPGLKQPMSIPLEDVKDL